MAKKRQFWLVDALRSLESKSLMNQSILFEILKCTESKQDAGTAAFKAIKSHVIPFYTRWILFSDNLHFLHGDHAKSIVTMPKACQPCIRHGDLSKGLVTMPKAW